MRLIYALPLLIALAVAWLVVRHVLERRRDRRWRERLKREPKSPRRKASGDTERSEMRAYEDATTVAHQIKKREPAARGPTVVGRDGTRSRAKL